MRRIDWRAIVPFLAFAAVWWGITLLAHCDPRGPRPTELVPAEEPVGQK